MAKSPHISREGYYTAAETFALLGNYYSKKETNELLAGLLTVTDADGRYYKQADVDALLAGKSDTDHAHDDRYYTQAEIDTMLPSSGIDKLWSNSNPSTSFSPSTKTLDGNISDYDLLMVVYIWSASAGHRMSMIVPAEYMTTGQSIFLSIARYDANYTGGRLVTVASDTSVTFGDGRYNGNSSQNNYAVPLAIYGLNILSRPSEAEIYDGPYSVTPDFSPQTLGTYNKQMIGDVNVDAIGLSYTSNQQGGNTVYIGGEIEED